MKSNKSAPLVLIAAAATTLAGATAHGQAMEVVTVEAMREIVVGKTAIGATIRELSIRSRVSYADLDLTRPGDVATLEQRIEETARTTCKEIKVEMPAEGSTEARCVKEAIDDAMLQVAKAVEAAKAAKQ